MSKVPNEINARARDLIVGEAPGADEVRAGRPFVGKSGQLLDRALAAVGMKREEFNITNVCDTRPANNDIENFWIKKNKVPGPQLVEGRDRLLRTIGELGPRAILAFGNTAAWALLGKQEITARRGSIYELDGIPVLVTLHPAAVLRDPKTVNLWLRDIARFKELRDNPIVRGPEYGIVVNPTQEQVQRYTAMLLESDLVAVDIEARGGVLACVGFAAVVGDKVQSICIPAITPDQLFAIRALLGSSVPKVFHNAPYDVAFLKFNNGITVHGEINDTLAMHQVLQPELPRDLATLASLYTRQPYYKDMGASDDMETFYRYNCLDVCVTIEVARAVSLKLKESGLWPVYEGVRRVLPHAIGMSLDGVPYSAEEAARQMVRWQRRQRRWQAILDGRVRQLGPDIVKRLKLRELHEAPRAMAAVSGVARQDKESGGLFNVMSPMKTLELCKVINLPVADTTEKSLMGAFGACKNRKHRKILRALIQTRRCRKMISSYLSIQPDQDGRIRTSYNPAGTETGRWSASKFIITRGANLQTIPPSWKICFQAPEDHVFWMADYSQIEARFVAYDAQDTAQIAVFEDPKGDIHKYNASLIFGVSIEDVTDFQRQVAKMSVHAMNYGITPEGLVKQVNKRAAETGFWLTLDLAKRVRNIYMQKFPKLVSWQERIWDEVRRTRRLTNPFGRTRIFLGGMAAGSAAEHTRKEALAFRPQSTVPDMMNKAIVTLRENPPVEGFETMMQVHDALGGIAPANCKDVWIPKILEAMNIPVNFHGREVRVPVELKIGPSLAQLRKV